MTDQRDIFDSQTEATPRHGRHAAASGSSDFGVSAFDGQDSISHSLHAAKPGHAVGADEGFVAYEGEQSLNEQGSGHPSVSLGEETELIEPVSYGVENVEGGSCVPGPDLSGLSEYTYGAPVPSADPSSYEYGMGDLPAGNAQEVDSVLPEKLRSKTGSAPRRVLKAIGKIVLIVILFGAALGLGALVGLVNLMDVNPLVLLALN